MDDNPRELADAVVSIQNNSASLQSLSKGFPDTWKLVIDDLNRRVAAKELNTLGASRSHAVKSLSVFKESRSKQSSHELRQIIQAKMTVLAIDQFADVLTGKIGLKPKFTDQVLLRFMLLPRLISGKPISTKAFDKLWKWFSDPLWAAGELQRQGFWSVPTLEVLSRFKQHALERGILELASGRGLYVAGLNHLGVAVRGTDNQSWGNEANILPSAISLIENNDAVSSLKKFSPAVVICSWPPPDNEFEKVIFATKSVQLYLAVVSKHSFASGNWRDYQSQKGFDCSTSEPLNNLLRPIELDQQVLIFRRK